MKTYKFEHTNGATDIKAKDILSALKAFLQENPGIKSYTVKTK